MSQPSGQASQSPLRHSSINLEIVYKEMMDTAQANSTIASTIDEVEAEYQR